MAGGPHHPRPPGIGGLEEILRNTAQAEPDASLPRLLAPCDLQAIKACGVTFAVSLLERVIDAYLGAHHDQQLTSSGESLTEGTSS